MEKQATKVVDHLPQLKSNVHVSLGYWAISRGHALKMGINLDKLLYQPLNRFTFRLTHEEMGLKGNLGK